MSSTENRGEATGPGSGSVDSWLRKQVLPAVEALKADPARALSVDHIHKHLAKKRQRQFDERMSG